MRGDSFVYFLQHSDDGPIKIGRSRNPEVRRVELQTGNPFPLRFLLIIRGGPAVEHEMQLRFAHLRMSPNPIRRSGGAAGQRRVIGEEWFSPGPDLLAFIDAAKEGR